VAAWATFGTMSAAPAVMTTAPTAILDFSE